MNMNINFPSGFGTIDNKCKIVDNEGNRICSFNSAHENGLCGIHEAAREADAIKADEVKVKKTKKTMNTKHCEAEKYLGSHCSILCDVTATFCPQHARQYDEQKDDIEAKKLFEQKIMNEAEEKYSHIDGKIVPIIKNNKIIAYKCFTISCDDDLAAKIFKTDFVFEDMCLIQKHYKTLYMYDEETGMWLDDEKIQCGIIQKAQIHLYHMVMDSKSGDYVMPKKPISFTSCKSARNVLQSLDNNFKNTNFLSIYDKSTIGKLLFLDGVFDFEKFEYEPFNPKYVFVHRIGMSISSIINKYKTGIYTAEDVQKVEDIYFNNLFVKNDEDDYGKLLSQYVRITVAKSLHGGFYKEKAGYFFTGSANSGKGTLTDALVKTFPGYVTTFNANSLLMKTQNSDSDESTKIKWLLPVISARLAISNEIDIQKNDAGKYNRYINANLYKTLTGGGDQIEIRDCNEKQKDVYKRNFMTTLFMMANDFPPFTDNKDSGILARKKDIHYPFNFVDEIVDDSFQRKKDLEVKNFIDLDKTKELLFIVLVKTYKNDILGKTISTNPPVSEYAAAEEKENNKTFEEFILERYEISKEVNKNIFVNAPDLTKYIADEYTSMSAQKINREFVKIAEKYKMKEDAFDANGTRYIEMFGQTKKCKVRLNLILKSD